MSRLSGTSEDTVQDASAVLARRTMTCKIVPTSCATSSQTDVDVAILGAAGDSRKLVDAGLEEIVRTYTASLYLSH